MRFIYEDCRFCKGRGVVCGMDCKVCRGKGMQAIAIPDEEEKDKEKESED